MTTLSNYAIGGDADKVLVAGIQVPVSLTTSLSCNEKKHVVMAYTHRRHCVVKESMALLVKPTQYC